MNTELYYIGANGNRLDLFNDDYFDIVEAENLTGIENEIFTVTNPYMDGDHKNNILTEYRSITLDLRVKNYVDVEEAKRHVMRTVKAKQTGRLRLVQGNRETEITGTVEGIRMPRFSNEVIMQISLHCSEPYWEDMDSIVVGISRILNAHHFKITFPQPIPLGVYDTNMTKTYTNEGDAECGMEITIIALGEVKNPVIYKDDGTFIGVDVSMVGGDNIVINTKRGQKSITMNGSNIFSKIRKGSTFLQMDVGDNEFTIDSEEGTEGNMYFTLAFKRRFI